MEGKETRVERSRGGEKRDEGGKKLGWTKAGVNKNKGKKNTSKDSTVFTRFSPPPPLFTPAFV